jgi:hypothetical protein
LLKRLGLPVSEPLLDYEKSLGGWSSTNPYSESGNGIYLCLQEGNKRSATAAQLEKRGYLFEGKRDEPDEEGDMSPIWGTGFPRLFFQDRPLVPGGMLDQDCIYFVGTQGEVYLYVDLTDTLVLLAGSGRTLLESGGLGYQKAKAWYEAHICADVSGFLSDLLCVPDFEPACDQFFRWWANDTAQIRLSADYAPCIMGTHIACESKEDFLKAFEALRHHLQVDRVRVWKRANLIGDGRGLQALKDAEVDYEELDGEPPGHWQPYWDENKKMHYQPSLYDVSQCDPKNWHIPGPNLGISRA